MKGEKTVSKKKKTMRKPQKKQIKWDYKFILYENKLTSI